jgi:hypothetical protein
MFQIDNASAAASQPASSAPGVAGFFTDGNPASNIPATIVPAEWLNATMLEIINAVTGSGQTLNKAAFNQLLTAIQTVARNPGVTPPQFDNSTKTATTAFVTTAGFHANSQYIASASGPLPLSAIGSYVTFTTVNVALTLPAAATVPVGNGIICKLQGAAITGCSLNLTGTDTFQNCIGTGNSTAPYNLVFGDSVFLVSDGGHTWSFINETSKTWLKNISSFGASLGGNGYQLLPSGVIIQWGAISTGSIPASGLNTGTFTYPIAFPNLSPCCLFNPSNAGAASVIGGSYSATSKTACNWFANNLATVAQSVILGILAIGY